jgi:hypothetical protein
VVISLAISGSVFLNEAVKGLSPILSGVPRETVKAAVAGSGSEFFRSLTGETRALVLHAIIEAMNKNYILIIVAGGVTIIGSLFMKVRTPKIAMLEFC